MLRLLWRDRTTTVMAVTVLALGIGATTALFSVVNAVLLKPLPFPAADRLVVLRVADPDYRDRYPSFPANAGHIDEWQRSCRSCEALAAIKTITVTLTGVAEPEQLDTARVTANYLAFFGSRLLLGRTFLPEEDRPGAAPVIVISHALWTRRFGADPSVIGRAVSLDGVAHVIVGVLSDDTAAHGPERFGALVRLPPRIDVFRPAAFTPDERRSRGDMDYGVVARLRPGVTLDAARAELDGIEVAIARRDERRVPLTAVVEPLHDVVVQPARGPLLILMGATLGVLLIVCVNLANLLLARQQRRRRDGAIRTALGASPGRLLQEGLLESLVVALTGGTLGVLAAWAAARALAASATTAAAIAVPRLQEVALDARVLVVALGATLLVGLVVGLLPALRAAASNPADSLGASSRSATDSARGLRGRRVLVSAQAALTAALLVATALLLTSFVRLLAVDKGFATSGVLTLDVVLPPSSYRTAPEQLQAVDRLLDRLRALPGVESVAVTSRLPLQGEASVNTLSLEHDPRPVATRPLANYRYVSPAYFTTMGTPLVRGRTFLDTDRQKPVVILSAEAARALWPGEEAVGRFVRTGGALGALSEVIGVAADSRAIDLRRSDMPIAYLPYWLRGPAVASIALRVSADPAATMPAAREAIWSVDRNIPIPRTRTMREIVDGAIADRRLELTLMVLFGCAAALLAGLGVYGVVSYSVASRAREMGIRSALGATPFAIRRQVIGEAVLPVAVGLAAGLLASWPIGRAMASLLFQVRAVEPIALAGAATVLLGAAIVASLGPARRAAGQTVLRAD